MTERDRLLLAILIIALAAAGLMLGMCADSGSLSGDPSGSYDADERTTSAEGFAAALSDGDNTSARIRLADADADSEVKTFGLAGFRGRVLDRSGTPARDVEISILSIGREAIWRDAVALFGTDTNAPDLVAGTARTDAEGHFLVSGVWPRSFYMLHAGKGTGETASQILSATPGPGEVVDLGDIYLDGAATISGRVVDERDLPIADARVCAIRIPGHLAEVWPIERFDPQNPLLFVDGDVRLVLTIPEWLRERIHDLPIVTCRSDEGGRFRLVGIQPDRVVVTVDAPGRRPELLTAVQVTAGEETDVGTITVERGTTVRGRVMDAAGRPVAGAEVIVGQGTAVVPLIPARAASATDAAGRFAVGGFGPGDFVAAARRGPDTAWVVGSHHAVGEESVLVIPHRANLTLDVRSRAGIPVIDPRFKLIPAAPGTLDVDLDLLGLRPAPPLARQLRNLDDGRYRFVGLQQGRYVLLTAAEGHGVEVSQFHLRGDLELRINLGPPREFGVLVTDESGEPVTGARVDITARGDFPRMPRMPVPVGTTDPDGRIMVTNPTSDRVAVRASHPAHGLVERVVTLPIDVVHLHLRPPGSIAGILTEAGLPPTAGRWSLAVQRAEATAEDILETPSLVTPDADGRFRIDGLPPGRYRVSATHRADSTSLALLLDRRAFERRFHAPRCSQVVPVRPGETTRVEIDTKPRAEDAMGPAGRVLGTVLVNGRPGTGLAVRGWHKRWLEARVSADGTFDLGRVPEGTVGLYLVDPEATDQGHWEVLWWQEIDVARDVDFVLDIDVDLGSVTGSVIHANGEPVAGCQVKLTGDTSVRPAGSARTKLYGVTDRSGRFSFPDLPAGSYTASVWDKRLGRGSVGDIEVASGVRAEVVVRLISVVRITGRVEMSMLGPRAPRWCWLELYGKSDDGRYVSSEHGTKVRADGSFELQGIPPGRYEVSIGAMFWDSAGDRWETRMFVHERNLEVGPDGLRGVAIWPAPRPAKRKSR